MNFSTDPIRMETWSIDRLIPYARNPRKNDAAVDRMCSSIREFGFKIPCLVRSDGEVVDGHLRLKAARKLGIADIPVILCDEWTAAQVKAFRLLVNRSAMWADWEEELLKIELLDLQTLDFDLSLTGFDTKELDDFLLNDTGRGCRAAAAGGSSDEARRSVALWFAPGTLRGRHRHGRRVAASGRTPAVLDGDRSSLRD
jgi:ParB-like chromosome segregation protein Spo0J